MTVFLGSVTQQGSKNYISPPAALTSVEAVRITNITSDVLVLSNVAGNGQSLEYLLPMQQAVYKSEGSQQIPTVYGVTLGNVLPNSQIFVEWSDDPLNDFPGTYPTTIGSLAATAPGFENGVVTMANANTTYSIPANPNRLSLSFTNTGSVPVMWLPTNPASPWAGTNPTIAAGNGVELNTSAVVYLQSTSAGGQVTYWGETV